MNSVDVLVLIVLLLNALMGAIRGFVYQACRLLSIFGSFWLAGHFGHDVGDALTPWLDVGDEGRVVVAWVSIFVVVYAVMSLLIHVFRKGLAKARLTGADRSLGFLLGLVKGAIFVAIGFQILAFWSPAAVEDQLIGAPDRGIEPSRAFAVHRDWIRERMDRMVPEEVRKKADERIEKKIFGR